EAIDFAIKTKAVFSGTGAANVRVLSNSWGGNGFSQSLYNEINKANTNDILFVAAAGNEAQNNDTAASPFYPASFQNLPNLISVVATTSSDTLAGFSNFGKTTTNLGAPGTNVLSTILGASYDYFNGTSMATPHVSGAAMLVLANCSLSTANLRSAILNNVDPVGALTNLTSTGGRLNVNRAVRSCATGGPGPFSKLAPANGAIGVPLNGTLSWSASAGATGYEYCVDTIANGTCDTSWTPTTALSA